MGERIRIICAAYHVFRCQTVLSGAFRKRKPCVVCLPVRAMGSWCHTWCSPSQPELLAGGVSWWGCRGPARSACVACRHCSRSPHGEQLGPWSMRGQLPKSPAWERGVPGRSVRCPEENCSGRSCHHRWRRKDSFGMLFCTRCQTSQQAGGIGRKRQPSSGTQSLSVRSAFLLPSLQSVISTVI